MAIELVFPLRVRWSKQKPWRDVRQGLLVTDGNTDVLHLKTPEPTSFEATKFYFLFISWATSS